ncbi:hypothetical protein CHUAL_014050 [Chamberlinius hualienensis]
MFSFTKYRFKLMLLVSFCGICLWYNYNTVQSVVQPKRSQNNSQNETNLLKNESEFNADLVTNLMKNYKVMDNILGNLNDFRLLTDCNVCDGESDIFMLILVGSHAAHASQRNVLRSTLSRPGIDKLIFKMVFTFGLLTDVDSQRSLEEESQQYKDIIQGNFIDSYQNVTHRDLMAFRWAWQRCPQARYIMRLDDDTSVNIFKLVDVLRDCCSHKPVFIGCFDIWHNAPVYRDGRYGLTREEHEADTFEDYCFGWMYVTTSLMAFLLDWVSNYVHYYWLNDAFISGSLVGRLGIRHTHLHIEYTFGVDSMTSMLENKTDKKYIVGPNNCDANLTQALFDKFKSDAQQQLTTFVTYTNVPTTLLNSSQYYENDLQVS